MHEQTRNAFLAVGAWIVAGIALLIGINFLVTRAMAPVSARMAALSETQNRIDKKIDVLERKIDSLDQKIATGALCRGSQGRQPSPAEDLNKVYVLDVGVTPVKGPKDAAVMITMFADFECPYCSRFYEPIKEVLKAYPDKVKLMVKNYPLGFHQRAVPAAKFALAAHLQGKYFEAIDILMKNRADVSEAKVKEYAQALALDENKLKEDLKNKDAEFDKQIKDDMKLGVQSDVRGTPTFFLNGKKSGARDINSWKAEIDRVLGGKALSGHN